MEDIGASPQARENERTAANLLLVDRAPAARALVRSAFLNIVTVLGKLFGYATAPTAAVLMCWRGERLCGDEKWCFNQEEASNFAAERIT